MTNIEKPMHERCDAAVAFILITYGMELALSSMLTFINETDHRDEHGAPVYAKYELLLVDNLERALNEYKARHKEQPRKDG